jgi:hypothetical protein
MSTTTTTTTKKRNATSPPETASKRLKQQEAEDALPEPEKQQAPEKSLADKKTKDQDQKQEQEQDQKQEQVNKELIILQIVRKWHKELLQLETGFKDGKYCFDYFKSEIDKFNTNWFPMLYEILEDKTLNEALDEWRAHSNDNNIEELQSMLAYVLDFSDKYEFSLLRCQVKIFNDIIIQIMR